MVSRTNSSSIETWGTSVDQSRMDNLNPRKFITVELLELFRKKVQKAPKNEDTQNWQNIFKSYEDAIQKSKNKRV